MAVHLLANSPLKIIAKSAVQLSYTGGTSESTLATVTVPGGSMGPNGIIKITTLWTMPNNANSKTLRIRFGGNLILNIAATTSVEYRDERMVCNRGAQNAQVAASNGLGAGGWGTTTGGLATLSVDTSSDVDIVFAALLANAADSIGLEYYCIELLA